MIALPRAPNEHEVQTWHAGRHHVIQASLARGLPRSLLGVHPPHRRVLADVVLPVRLQAGPLQRLAQPPFFRLLRPDAGVLRPAPIDVALRQVPVVVEPPPRRRPVPGDVG